MTRASGQICGLSDLGLNQPVPALDDALGPIWYFGRRQTVVGSVTDVIVDDFCCFMIMALRGGDCCQVEARDLLIWRYSRRQFGSGTGNVQLFLPEAAGRNDMSHVDDCAEHVLVQPIAFGEPGPATWSQLVERRARNQAQR